MVTDYVFAIASNFLNKFEERRPFIPYPYLQLAFFEPMSQLRLGYPIIQRFPMTNEKWEAGRGGGRDKDTRWDEVLRKDSLERK